MPEVKSQISAYIPNELKLLMERYARAHGVKKNHIIEQALWHHLQTLQEIPLDVIIPANVTVTAASMQELTKKLKRRPKPPEALVSVMRSDP